MSYRLVISTCPNMEVAESLATTLVSEKLAACVNILPGARSIYEWQGKMQREDECVLLIKTRNDRIETLSTRLLEEHPYELPEIIAVPIETGLPPYLAWIDAQLDK